MGIMQADKRILTDPAPVVYVKALADSSVDLLARCWVKRSDYWLTSCDLNESFKGFDEGGVNIPYPQRDVHISSN